MASPGIRYRGDVDPPAPTAPLRGGAPDEAPDLQSTHAHDAYWPRVASRDEIPLWLRDNEFLLHGHPMPTASYRKSYRLWRCLHMETMNIWTHLLASAAFTIAGVAVDSTVLKLRGNEVLPGDGAVFGIFFAACAVAFGLSANFHTLRSHSYRIHHLWGRMDILGICMLAFGGGFSATYSVFYHDATSRYVYWALNATAAIAAAVTLFDTGGGGSKMRTLRGIVFGTLTLSAMVPITQRNVQLGWQQGCRQLGAEYYLAEGLVLLLGVCFFVGRIPERFFPGAFDVWGHSHQLWHICAALGMAFHAMALISGYRYRHGYVR